MGWLNDLFGRKAPQPEDGFSFEQKGYNPSRYSKEEVATIIRKEGLTLLESGKLEEALDYFQRTPHRDHHLAHYGEGTAIFRLITDFQKESFEIGDSIRALEKALDLNPLDSDAYLILGMALMYQASLHKKAFQKQPILLHLHRYTESLHSSRSCFSRAEKLQPNYAPTVLDFWVAMEKELAQAKKLEEEIMEREGWTPKEVQVVLDLQKNGQHLIDAQRYEEAIEYFENTPHQEHYLTKVSLGVAKFRKFGRDLTFDQLDEIIQLHSESISLKNDFPDSWYFRAIARLKMVDIVIMDPPNDLKSDMLNKAFDYLLASKHDFEKALELGPYLSESVEGFMSVIHSRFNSLNGLYSN